VFFFFFRLFIFELANSNRLTAYRPRRRSRRFSTFDKSIYISGKNGNKGDMTG